MSNVVFIRNSMLNTIVSGRVFLIIFSVQVESSIFLVHFLEEKDYTVYILYYFSQ